MTFRHSGVKSLPTGRTGAICCIRSLPYDPVSHQCGAEDEKVGAESRDVFEVGIGSTFGEDLDTRGIRDLTAQVFGCAGRVGGHRVSGEDRQFEAVPRIEGNDVLWVRRNDQLLVAARELEGLRVLGRRTFRAAARGEKRGRSDARADAEETASRQVVHDRPVVAIGRGGRKESSHAC